MPLSPAQFTALTRIYEGEIDSIIENFGKDCTFVFPAIVVNQNNTISDPIRHDSKKPFYKSSDEPVPTEERETKIIRGTIEHNPSSYQDFGIKLRDGKDIILFKTYSSFVPDIKRAEFMIPDINVEKYFGKRYRLIREPVPRGLQNNRYVEAYFEMI